MTPTTKLIATIAILFISALIVALVDRWSKRRALLRRIDIIKRGEILPFRRAD